jgi:tRNA (guanosine-2'-O-)-methyltransferase
MGGGPGYEGRETPAPEGLLLEVRKERIEEIVRGRTRTLTVVLDSLEDTFNMAAVLRTCEAMGLQEVHAVVNRVAGFVPNGKVTQGCEKWLDIHLYPDFSSCREKLKARGFSIWASARRAGSQSLTSLSFDAKIALVFGNERFGVSPEVLGAADGLFWIPLRGFTQSLNVSAAVSASLSHAVGWREAHLGRSGDLSDEEAQALTEKFSLLSVKQRARIYRPNDLAGAIRRPR